MTKKLGLTIFFFLAEFFAFTLLSDQDVSGTRPRLLESVNEGTQYNFFDSRTDRRQFRHSNLLSDVSIILWFTLQSTMYAVDTFLVVFKSISGVFISAAQDETGILDFIEEKFQRRQCFPRSMLRKILRLSEDIAMFQAFSVLCYAVGQLYNSHYVAFDPAEYSPQKYQRFASLLLYLSGVEDGGETVFPFENGMYMNGSYGFKDYRFESGHAKGRYHLLNLNLSNEKDSS